MRVWLTQNPNSMESFGCKWPPHLSPASCQEGTAAEVAGYPWVPSGGETKMPPASASRIARTRSVASRGLMT
jgi:hypothetical protein